MGTPFALTTDGDAPAQQLECIVADRDYDRILDDNQVRSRGAPIIVTRLGHQVDYENTGDPFPTLHRSCHHGGS